MSSKFPAITLWLAAFVQLAAVLLETSSVRRCEASPLAAERAVDIVRVEGATLPQARAVPVSELSLHSCDGQSCKVIPHQLDERDPFGRWILSPADNPVPADDGLPGRFDDRDVILFAARDLGERVPSERLPLGTIAALQVRDPLLGGEAWVYLTRGRLPANSPGASSVYYEPLLDRLVAPRVALGFVDGVPRYLALGDGNNLLDRLKVRANASFLGLFRLSRNEDDLETELVGWRAGPIRVIRAQRQRVRLGWGIRSPSFLSYTYFYVTDFAELPVSFRLSFPPAFLFRDIAVQVLLDFRDLRGWEVWTPSGGRIPVGTGVEETKHVVGDGEQQWFALKSREATLVHYLGTSRSLDSVRRRFVYREPRAALYPPESEPGELPGVGFELDQWEGVGAGAHALQASSYVVPAGVDVRQFMRAQAHPLEVLVVDPSAP
jgi:hypothetical protein